MPRCPDCDERVSSSDSECPSCGVALRPGKRPSSGGGMSTGSIVLIILGVGAACLLVCGGILAALLLPAVQQARNAARMSQSKNNLKQVGLALMNYHDMYQSFPAGGVYSEAGEGQHGWGTAILPMVEQAGLYQSIDLSQPWNSPRNQSAMSAQVATYLNPGVDQKTSPEGYGLFHYAGNSHVLLKNEYMKYRNVSDGSSNTLLIGEVSSDYKPWGAPDNVRDPSVGLGQSATQFGSPVHPKLTNFLLADGAVRSISDSIDLNVLKALSTPNGGEVVNEF